MGELLNAIVQEAAKPKVKRPELFQDEHGMFYFFKVLPENAIKVKREDYPNLLQILPVKAYFLLESAVTGFYELHKVSEYDNVFNLWKFIKGGQLYIYQ